MKVLTQTLSKTLGTLGVVTAMGFGVAHAAPQIHAYHTATTVAAKNASIQGKVNSNHANVNAKINQKTNHNTHNSKTYTVRSGDTLRSIAKRYGVSYSDIARASNISTNTVLRVGQILLLP